MTETQNQPSIIDGDEPIPFQARTGTNIGAHVWNDITKDVVIEGKYDDNGANTPKKFKSTHKHPINQPREKKEKEIVIEDEFNDDINKEKPEVVDDDPVSHVEKKKLPTPQPVIIDEDEKNNFQPNEQEKMASQKWQSITREVRVDGEYDDVGDVVPKELRRSHPSPKPQVHEKKPRKIPEIEDEFNDDINKEPVEENEDEEAVSYVEKKKLPTPQPVIIEEEEKNTFKPNEHEKRAASAWTNITREVKIDGEYDDVGDVVSKSLRHSHSPPRPPTHEKKPRKIPEYEDEFNDDLNIDKEEVVEQEESVSYVEKKKLPTPQPVVIEEEEKNTFKPNEHEKRAANAWTNITREVKMDGEYDDVGDVVPKSLRHSHPSPRPPTHEKKPRKIPEIEDEFNDDINAEKPEVEEEESVSYVQKKKLPAPQPVVIEEEEKNNFKQNEQEKKAANAWTNITRKIKMDGTYDDVGDVVSKSLRHSHPSPRPATHGEKSKRNNNNIIIEDEFNDDINNEKPEVEEEAVSYVQKKHPVAPKPVVIEEDEQSPYPQKNNANAEKAKKAWGNISREIRIEGEYNDEDDYENLPKNLKGTHKHPVYIPKGQRNNNYRDNEDEFVDEPYNAPPSRPKSVPPKYNNADQELTEEEMENIAATVTCRGLDPGMLPDDSVSDLPKEVCKECHMVPLRHTDKAPVYTDAERQKRREENSKKLLEEIKAGKIDRERLARERAEIEEDRRRRVAAIKEKMAKRGNVPPSPEQKQAALAVAKALQDACALLMSKQQ